MLRYYDWGRTLTYSQAYITMVISARGFGKTYGLRKQAIRDFLKDGSRFVEIVRYKNELEGEDAIQNGYFDKLIEKGEFPDYVFKVQGTKAYIAKASDDKPKWELIAYFVALSSMQKAKKRTFANVRKVIFDEFIIDKRTRIRYLPDECSLFVNMIDSLARQEAGTETKVRAFLLGNACDLINPYFVRFGIDSQPESGFHWYAGKKVLLHYCVDESYQEAKKNTLVGFLVKGTKEESVIVGNEFRLSDTYDIESKPDHARYEYTIIFKGTEFAFWLDSSEGRYFINDRTVPEGSYIAVTREDNSVNTMMLKRNHSFITGLGELYRADCLRFETESIRERFMELLSFVGAL